MSRLTKTLTAASAIMCAIALVILAASYCLGGRPHMVALISPLYIGILEGHLEFSSQSLREAALFQRRLGGPAGTVRELDWTMWAYGMRQQTITGTGGNISERVRVLMFPGMYSYRKKCGQQPALWTLVVSLWYPVLALAGLPALSIFRWWGGGGPNERGAGDGAPSSHLSSGATGPAAP